MPKVVSWLIGRWPFACSGNDHTSAVEHPRTTANRLVATKT
ncbi:hypothetical protein ACWGKS_08670 [Nocardiopsis sp. NPDC055879]